MIMLRKSQSKIVYRTSEGMGVTFEETGNHGAFLTQVGVGAIAGHVL